MCTTRQVQKILLGPPIDCSKGAKILVGGTIGRACGCVGSCICCVAEISSQNKKPATKADVRRGQAGAQQDLDTAESCGQWLGKTLIDVPASFFGCLWGVGCIPFELMKNCCFGEGDVHFASLYTRERLDQEGCCCDTPAYCCCTISGCLTECSQFFKDCFSGQVCKDLCGDAMPDRFRATTAQPQAGVAPQLLNANYSVNPSQPSNVNVVPPSGLIGYHNSYTAPVVVPQLGQPTLYGAGTQPTLFHSDVVLHCDVDPTQPSYAQAIQYH